MIEFHKGNKFNRITLSCILVGEDEHQYKIPPEYGEIYFVYDIFVQRQDHIGIKESF